MKIIVSGSSGTIGTRLCEKLLEKNHEIIGLDIKPNKWNGKINSKTIISDMRKKDFFTKLPKADLFVHLAANARVYNLVVEPELALDNIQTVHNALEFCRKNNLNKFIFASSREVYGNSGKSVHKESDFEIDNCESPYSASKISGEALIRSYEKCYGIEFIITRYSNVYGMYDESDRFIPLTIRKTKNGEDLFIFGKTKSLDFTYIDDTIEGILRCIENFPKAKNNVFNIASGESESLENVAKLIQAEMKAKTAIKFGGNRKGEVVRFTADISKAKKLLGYEPKIGIKEGIKRSVKWYAENVEF